MRISCYRVYKPAESSGSRFDRPERSEQGSHLAVREPSVAIPDVYVDSAAPVAVDTEVGREGLEYDFYFS